jgi:hypothetical protein
MPGVTVRSYDRAVCTIMTVHTPTTPETGTNRANARRAAERKQSSFTHDTTGVMDEGKKFDNV